MSSYGVSVTVGRNIDGAPMSERMWWDFRHAVQDLVRESALGVECAGSEQLAGVGKWGSDVEENYRHAIYGLSEADARLVADNIRTPLADLAAMFEQDCVALSVYETELVGL